MLGRGVATRLEEAPRRPLISAALREVISEADLFILNLECCISARGSPWPDPAKMFFFRAPPVAARALRDMGVSCVTLANNHALDFGQDALVDTVRYLDEMGIRHIGAGWNVDEARAPAILEKQGMRLAVFGVTDHPASFSAEKDRPGVAFADLRREVPEWLVDALGTIDADATLVTPHWGPNMTSEPLPFVRAAARALVDAGATLIAGHSAHVFHGVDGNALFDLGDFVDDYAVDPVLRNDLGLLFLVTLGRFGIRRIEAVPLKLTFCFTGLAGEEDAAAIGRRFRAACSAFGTEVREERGRLLIDFERDDLAQSL